MSESADGQRPRVLILALHHGSTHVRIARALEKALLRLRPNLKVEVVDALAHCTPWFRAYYNSYEIPLKYWPGLWNYIESHQFEGETSGPWWLYRRGARPLFRFIDEFRPRSTGAGRAPTTERGLNTECRGHPCFESSSCCKASFTSGRDQSNAPIWCATIWPLRSIMNVSGTPLTS